MASPFNGGECPALSIPIITPTSSCPCLSIYGESNLPAELARLDLSARFPLGWGPYIVKEWNAGENILLTKNLNYFRASNGLPHFDELNFIIMLDSNAAFSALLEGKCDVLDPTVHLDGTGGLASAIGIARAGKTHHRPNNDDGMAWHRRVAVCL
jgi:hypothetical protein